MRSTNKIYDRQIGRNAQLFAESLSSFTTKEERYPYIRILVSIIEQAHPEWNQAPTKDEQIAHLAMMLSGGILDISEISEIVRVRDEERGLIQPQVPAKKESEEDKAEDKKESKESADTASEESESDKEESEESESKDADAKAEDAPEDEDDSSDEKSDAKSDNSEKPDDSEASDEEGDDSSGEEKED